MLQKILTHFEKLTKIPHCSNNTLKMQEYIFSFAQKCGFKVVRDKHGNILASSNNPKVCLQAHLDMVCVGDAPKIEIVKENNFLRAKNSSLGADNAIAIAMMLVLMEEKVNAEFLFTNDEEIGLIGAKHLELKPKSSYLLNLDSEKEGEIYIGCAGGVDIVLEKDLKFFEKRGYFYELSIKDLPGGHSGIDIDKNIPNAIVELAKYIKKNMAYVVYFNGGERSNSIPANAKALIFSLQELKEDGIVRVKKADKIYKISNFDIDTLLALPNGVIEFNDKFNVVESSANLAIVKIEKKAVIIVSLRSLDNQKLNNLVQEIKEIFLKKDYKITLQESYPAWKPDMNEFTKMVQKAMEKVYTKADLKVIHAGLECGILKQKFPNMKIASIGPTILYPHSIKECVKIDSIKKTYQVILELLKSL